MAQSLASVELKPGFSAVYTRIEDGKPTGDLAIWASQDALLLRFKGESKSSYRLLRADGALLIEAEANAPRRILYGKPLTASPFDFPFQWASHPVLGEPKLSGSGRELTWSDMGADPRRDRSVVGEAAFDKEGRVRSLTWPTGSEPLGRMTISGWTDLVIGAAPSRMDLDLQGPEKSQSLAWQLSDESPPPRQGEDFTYEGLLEGRNSQPGPVPLADCRVEIESCPLLLYQPGKGPLLSQFGGAGPTAIKEPPRSAAPTVILTAAGVIFLFWIAKKVMSRKAKDG